MLILVAMPTLFLIISMFKKGVRVKHDSINDQDEAITSEDKHKG